MMVEMMIVAIIATIIVLILINRDGKKDGKKPLGQARTRSDAIRRSRKKNIDCSKVPIDSPDFERCGQTLGVGKSNISSKPRSDRMKNEFMKDDYKVGKTNPFSNKLTDKFKKDTDKKLGAHAFPFTQKSGPSGPSQSQRARKSPPPRGSSRSFDSGMNFQQAFLGTAAVSPSSLGASPNEMAQAANKLHNVNEVVSNTGGNLNLLHPL